MDINDHYVFYNLSLIFTFFFELFGVGTIEILINDSRDKTRDMAAKLHHYKEQVDGLTGNIEQLR